MIQGSNVRPRTERDFGWDFSNNVNKKRLRLIKGNEDGFNEKVNDISNHLYFKYKEVIDILTDEIGAALEKEFTVSNLGPWNQIKLIYEFNLFPFPSSRYD